MRSDHEQLLGRVEIRGASLHEEFVIRCTVRVVAKVRAEIADAEFDRAADRERVIEFVERSGHHVAGRRVLQHFPPGIVDAIPKPIEVVDEVLPGGVRPRIPRIEQVVLGHVPRRLNRRWVERHLDRATIQMRSGDRLRAVLVVQKERHRRAWAEPNRQLNRLPQAHDPGNPFAIDAVGDTELSDLADSLAVGQIDVDVFVVPELGVDPQAGRATDRVRQVFRAARDDLSIRFEFQSAPPSVHHRILVEF